VPAARAPETTLDDASAVRFAALKRWRLAQSRSEGVPAFVVFSNRTLEEIARVDPETLGELAAVTGVGPAKLESYGERVLAELGAQSAGLS
jgi:ATP-dependent DNA helicase RecQ